MRSRRAADILIGLSLANLLFWNVWRMLYAVGTPNAFFFSFWPNDYIAAMLCVVAGGALAGLAGWLARRVLHGTVNETIRALFMATPLLLIDTLRKAVDMRPPAMIRDVRLLLPAIAVVCVIT